MAAGRKATRKRPGAVTGPVRGGPWAGEFIGHGPKGRLTERGARTLVRALREAVKRTPKEEQMELKLGDQRRYRIRKGPQKK